MTRDTTPSRDSAAGDPGLRPRDSHWCEGTVYRDEKPGRPEDCPACKDQQERDHREGMSR